AAAWHDACGCAIPGQAAHKPSRHRRTSRTGHRPPDAEAVHPHLDRVLDAVGASAGEVVAEEHRGPIEQEAKCSFRSDFMMLAAILGLGLCAVTADWQYSYIRSRTARISQLTVVGTTLGTRYEKLVSLLSSNFRLRNHGLGDSKGQSNQDISGGL